MIVLRIKISLLLGICVALGSGSTAFGKNYNESKSNTAGGIFSTDALPGNGFEWVGVGPAESWPIAGKAINEKGFQICARGGASPTLTPGGDWSVDSFFDITYEFFLEVNGGPVEAQTGSGTMHIAGTAPAGQEPRVFAMEVLSLSMNGLLDPTTPFEIRESPTLPSIGTTTLTLQPDGQYRIDSFFDVFTEMSLDGGQSWVQGVGVPEPAAIWLAVTCGMILWAAPQGRKRI